ncbi:hypothetical protein [Poseidonocella sedimentorum]|nr:hypothetical protein [Poseidonocella sedimentorum]
MAVTSSVINTDGLSDVSVASMMPTFSGPPEINTFWSELLAAHIFTLQL